MSRAPVEPTAPADPIARGGLASAAASPTLSPMTAADLDAVTALAAKAFPIPWSRASFAEELARPHARCVVLRDGPTLVGYLVAWVLFDVVELLVVAVDPAHRGRGHGRRLVAHLIDLARAEGATRIQLEVRRGNTAAIALYERLGFRVVGLRAGYYQDDGEDALLMDHEVCA